MLFDGVIKYDLETGASVTRSWGEGCVGTEPCFVPRPGATPAEKVLRTFFVDLG